MSDFLEKIKKLLKGKDVRISEHGYDELAEDKLFISEIMNGINKAKVVEEYPHYPKGYCILVLQQDNEGKPVHVLWGIPKNYQKPAVLITAYRPDPDLWDKTFLNRI